MEYVPSIVFVSTLFNVLSQVLLYRARINHGEMEADFPCLALLLREKDFRFRLRVSIFYIECVFQALCKFSQSSGNFWLSRFRDTRPLVSLICQVLTLLYTVWRNFKYCYKKLINFSSRRKDSLNGKVKTA